MEHQDFVSRLVEGCDELLSIPEFARRCGGLSNWTICSYLSQGKLERIKIGGRTMIAASQLARIIKPGAKSKSPRQAHKTSQPVNPPAAISPVKVNDDRHAPEKRRLPKKCPQARRSGTGAGRGVPRRRPG
jgi:hypothetical protein